jgi:hypothetical protein
VTDGVQDENEVAAARTSPIFAWFAGIVDVQSELKR